MLRKHFDCSHVNFFSRASQLQLISGCGYCRDHSLMHRSNRVTWRTMHNSARTISPIACGLVAWKQIDDYRDPGLQSSASGVMAVGSIWPSGYDSAVSHCVSKVE